MSTTITCRKCGAHNLRSGGRSRCWNCNLPLSASDPAARAKKGAILLGFTLLVGWLVLGSIEESSLTDAERAQRAAQAEASRELRAEQREAEQFAKESEKIRAEAAKERERKEARAARLCDDDVSAHSYARREVKRALEPRPAKTAPRDNTLVLPLGDCRHLVTGYVDTRNAFNADIRAWYAAWMYYSRTLDTWIVERLEIGDATQINRLIDKSS
ncbi:hypothetical protein [Thiococcus pfennigii]|uniref:hypothetical protein n=1 Tax=Thiococcus pfennigii TaxID=1057 RepID=UPI001903F96C|nr:hypothetical protein [Thiococcus pfennigii]MBK1731659.1 hypothetical protein [Thiococcus pfennigii]